MKGNATRGNKVSFGEYAMQSLEPGRINGRQIEAGRMACSHQYLARRKAASTSASSRTKSFSKKPLETRMGTGKGEPEFWAAEVKPGTDPVRNRRRG